MDPESLKQKIAEWSQEIEKKLKDLLPNNPSEAEFRQPIDQLLREFCAEVGLNPLDKLEYPLATGRADTVFNRLVIEYERPGTLSDKLSHQATDHAIEQVKRYIEELAQQQRHKLTRMAGVVFDGHYIIFVRYHMGGFQVEPPVPVNSASLERFLNWLASAASDIALTAENLNCDFSIKQRRTQDILQALMKGLTNALSASPNQMVKNLFEQWRLFFRQSIDYSEAFGGRKLEPLKKWVKEEAKLSISTPEEAERFFFVLHTYFALLARLLAWHALSRHMGVKSGAPSFGELISADSEKLRERLQKLEEGDIFRDYGLTNLLEGDFFAWYLYAWDTSIESALREILQRLDEYDPTTLTVLPEESRDLFKKLYQHLLPPEIRHNLGEYYTPDWLAQWVLAQVDSEFFTASPCTHERQLRKKLLNTRWLDPACGSGTFLVLIIARMKELGQALNVNKDELLNAILSNVVGFDLNPLAVLTARVNYLLAIADLLRHRKSEITIPVYLADSVQTPVMGKTLLNADAYKFLTAVGTFLVPAVLCTKERFDRFCNILEESVREQISPDAFVSRVEEGLAPLEWQPCDAGRAREVYERISDLHQRGMNGLWARLLKNHLAPLTVGQFDYIVGNPPWINWEHLPDKYREKIKEVLEHYKLAATYKGKRPRLGAVKMDISALMTYVVMDTLLKDGGKLGFVITQSLFKTAGAGAGFRRFLLPPQSRKSRPIRVLHVDDMVSLQPFEGASNRTAVMVLEKGSPTKYPVPYTVWRKVPGAQFTYDSTLEEVMRATECLDFVAEPVNLEDKESPWLTARPKAIEVVRKVLGKSHVGGHGDTSKDYKAHEGVNTGGANAVYWVNIVGKCPNGLVKVRNITKGAKVKVDEDTHTIEPDLLFPLLRGRDVQRWQAEPSAMMIVPHDLNDPTRAYPERILQTNYPETHKYLMRFEKDLRNRSGYKQILSKREREFYGVMDIGTYTFASWKVVWTRLLAFTRANQLCLKRQ